MIAITGNTYPVKDQLRALGGKWNADQKAWMVPPDKAQQAQQIVAGAISSAPSNDKPFRYFKCQVCGKKADRYTKIYRSGECGDCYEERKMGY